MRKENKNLIIGLCSLILLIIAIKFVWPYLLFSIGYFFAWLSDINIYLGAFVVVLLFILAGIVGGYGRVREYMKTPAIKKNSKSNKKDLE